jgi:hypothetical protein
VRPYLKNKLKQKGMGVESSDRALACQAQDPEFKSKYHQKEKKKCQLKV